MIRYLEIFKETSKIALITLYLEFILFNLSFYFLND